ncbi:hypothetical protein [Tenacibaculum finnmarkense]|uniref:hypothetical protein n=1 Tax=Tenacibaculum finnmarkense TaxID=2781243 RepID=UPI001E600F32|nr:hypothetical protein [Tenacibaculum finnmarkense]MCD8402251.1 hypothetical protein [Tenacibaculum finnmarkense genomovar finnmarkense]
MAYKISINPLIDFIKGTELKKKRVIKNQKEPSVINFGWHQTSRACIKKSLSLNGDKTPIIEGVIRLNSKVVDKPRQSQNKFVSLEGMQKYLNIEIPEILKNHNLNIIKKRSIKSTFINNVEIVISPDIIFTMDYQGEKYIGGVKIHLSKGNIFDNKELKIVASVLHKYISEIAEEHDAIPLAEICYSMDVFGGEIICSSEKNNFILNEIREVCNEIKEFWNVA